MLVSAPFTLAKNLFAEVGSYADWNVFRWPGESEELTVTEESEALIFIVDDDEEFRRSLKVLVETRGYRVIHCGSGETFLCALRPAARCCLILDLHMPGTSGIDVLQTLKGRGIALPTIAITGAGNPQLEVDARRAGALAVLDKPLQKDRLFELISRALG